MPPKKSLDSAELRALLASALQNDQNGSAAALEAFMMTHSSLPGPRANLSLLDQFAVLVGEVVAGPKPPTVRLERLLDGWAAIPEEAAPANDPKVILPAAAVLAYGQVAALRPEWWDDEIGKLCRAAADPRWRVREMAATGLQKMLGADWARTLEALNGWLASDNPLVLRAAVAAVAEPPLLTDNARGIQALAVQSQALGWLMRLPAGRRREEDVRTLRQALGYAVSVCVVASPVYGFPFLEKAAASQDTDVRWVVRENLKKTRLQDWPDKVEALKTVLAAE
jgi:hypothetical protein